MTKHYPIEDFMTEWEKKGYRIRASLAGAIRTGKITPQMTLREMGEKIGLEKPHPQQIKHHLEMLRKIEKELN